jgi:hypothetical protein
MTIGTAAGTRVFIGPAGTPATLTAFQAILDANWIEVGEIEDAGEMGDESEAVTFTSLKDRRVRKLKGSRDAGTMTIVVGDDMLDTGQIAMEAAEASPLDFPFKVVLDDAVTIAGDNSEHYMFGKVMSKRRNIGSVNNVRRRTFPIGINCEILSTEPS